MDTTQELAQAVARLETAIGDTGLSQADLLQAAVDIAMVLDALAAAEENRDRMASALRLLLLEAEASPKPSLLLPGRDL